MWGGVPCYSVANTAPSGARGSGPKSLGAEALSPESALFPLSAHVLSLSTGVLAPQLSSAEAAGVVQAVAAQQLLPLPCSDAIQPLSPWVHALLGHGSPRRSSVELWCGVNRAGVFPRLRRAYLVLGQLQDMASTRAVLNPPSPLCLRGKLVLWCSSQAETRLPTALLLVPAALQPDKETHLPWARPLVRGVQ